MVDAIRRGEGGGLGVGERGAMRLGELGVVVYV